MTESFIDYQELVHKALKSVVREILLIVADKGLEGEHHYYITFRTGDEGVEVPQRLKTQYPIEMTIVIQHRFWDLKVDEDKFEIGLSFNQKPERLVIPFEAVTGLVDPAVRFALQFDAVPEQEDEGEELPFEDGLPRDEEAEPAREDNVVSIDAFRKN